MDLVEVGRVEALMRRHPERAAGKLFTEQETLHCRSCRMPAESFAARFAAKEATFKALGTGWSGGASWQEVEVRVNGAGAPQLVLMGKTLRIAQRRGFRRAHLSLTHTADTAGAFVVLEGGPDSIT